MSCRHGTVVVFGCINLAVGLILVTGGLMSIVKKSIVGPIGHGIWGGVWMIIAGAFGMAGGFKKIRGMEIAFMVLSHFDYLRRVVRFALAVLGWSMVR